MKLIALSVAEAYINTLRRLDEIKATVDRQEAKVYFERVKDVKKILHRLAVNIDGLLRKFILSGGFDIKA